MADQKRVLLLSYFFTPDLSACSFRSNALLEQLVKRYPDVFFDVVTTNPSRYSSFNPTLSSINQHENVNILRITIPAHNGRFIGELYAASYFFKQVIKQVNGQHYDLIYATSAKLLTATVASYLSRKKKVPLILDIRDLFVENVKDFFSPKIKLLLLPILNQFERYTFSQAKHINLVSPGFKAIFEAKRLDASLSFYTNGIDDIFLPRKQLNIGANHDVPLTILYAGNIGRAQTLEAIIPKMAHQLGDAIKIKVIGAGRRTAKLVDKLEELNLTNVEIIPPVAREELPYYYQRADVLFLNLDNSESLGNVIPSKLFEYAATGKPILCGATGYTRSFVENEIDNALVFYPNDADAAIKKLKLLSLDIQPRQRFIDKYTRRTIMRNMADSIMKYID